MSLAKAITKALGGDWNGQYGSVPGPGHSRSDRSVTVRDDETGRDVVVHSFAGDDWRAIKDDWRRQGLLPDRDGQSGAGRFQQPGDNAAAPVGGAAGGDAMASERGKVVAAFDYLRPDGGIAFRIERVEPGRKGRRKDFRVCHPNGAGGWAKGLNGFQPLPYRLPELLAAPADVVIHIVEGEKKADALAGLGLVATCNPFGAGKWPAAFADYLAGRRVAILPDNDEPGRRHAHDVADKLAGKVARVAKVELPGLPEKGDVVDWLAAGGNAPALAALVEAAFQSASAPPLPIICPAQWAGVAPPEREWIVEGWLARGSAAFLTGDGGIGKSLFTQQLATCVALGRPFLGLEAVPGVALYVTCEDDLDELQRRQAAINRGLGCDMADTAGRLYLVSLKGELGNELVSFAADGTLELGQRYRDLEATAKAIGAQFVAIDNVAQTFTGNENVRNQVASFCNLMDRLAMAVRGSVLFLGHPSKGGAEFSGSTGWEAHVRQRLFLDWADKGEGLAGDRDARILRRSKANYARAGAEVRLRWHEGCFALEADVPADARRDDEQERRLLADEAAFLACLVERARQRRPVSDSRNASNYAPKVFAEMPEGGGLGVATMAAAMERLLRKGGIEKATAADPLWRGEDRKPVLGLREVRQ